MKIDTTPGWIILYFAAQFLLVGAWLYFSYYQDRRENPKFALALARDSLLAISLVLAASVVHEGAHALVAISCGLRVSRIIWRFLVQAIETAPLITLAEPGVKIVAALAGPLASLISFLILRWATGKVRELRMANVFYYVALFPVLLGGVIFSLIFGSDGTIAWQGISQLIGK